MTRQEHMAWCKERALAYVDSKDLEGALASMMSDLRKHQETEDHPGIMLGMMLKMSGKLNTPEETKKFIEGFN